MYTVDQIKQRVTEKTNTVAQKILDRGDSRAIRNHGRYVEAAADYISAIGKITNVKLANSHIEVFENETLSASTMSAMTECILEKMI